MVSFGGHLVLGNELDFPFLGWKNIMDSIAVYGVQTHHQ